MKSFSVLASAVLFFLPANLHAFEPADLVGRWVGYRAEGRKGTVQSWKSRMRGFVAASGAVRIVETSVWSIRITHVFHEDGRFSCSRMIAGELLGTAEGTWSAKGEEIEVQATYAGNPAGRDFRGTFTKTKDGFEFKGRDQRRERKPMRVRVVVSEKN